MCASTYPEKLIDNLRKEIEALKAENKRLQNQLADAGWRADQERQSWSEYRSKYPGWI